MGLRYDRIEKAQALMQEHGLIGIMIMNHDDYRYFFGRDWAQPRAIIPFSGPPIIISSKGEEPEIQEYIGDAKVLVFAHVGGQIQDVTRMFREIIQSAPTPSSETKAKVGMQLWFDTPAFLVDLFRKVNPELELVSSDPIMDALRMVKEPSEVDLMIRAQSIASKGMDRAREMLRPGVHAREVASEALCTMLKEGAEGTSVPIHVNFGVYTCMLHGGLSPKPLKKGDLVVIDLTPKVEGYCANLARSFVLGEPNDTQQKLHHTYLQMVEETRRLLKPGITVKELDEKGKEICMSHGFGDYHIDGISHGIGLRFEETPASTIIKPHRNVQLQEGMTVTAGHTILAISGEGGVRNEDIYLVT